MPKLAGRLRLLTAFLLASLFFLSTRETLAAGLFLAPRGVRPLAFAGAFVAGADDALALAYNPSGLAWAASGLALDAIKTNHTSHFLREMPQGTKQPTAPVVGYAVPLPIPNLGGVWRRSKTSCWAFGFLVGADIPLLQNWPDARKNPLTPARYSAGRIDGTALVKVSGGVAHSWFHRKLRLGLGVNAWLGTFRAQTTLSACDGFICQAPEDPNYDIHAIMTAEGILGRSLSLGIGYTPFHWLDLGLSLETEALIQHRGTLDVVLPSAALFRSAMLVPTKPEATLSMGLPLALRLGARFHLRNQIKVEIAAAYEPWHVHRAIDVRVHDAAIKNVIGLGGYDIQDVALERGLKDSFSVRMGGEKAFSIDSVSKLLTRLGAMIESGTAAQNVLTPLAIDLNKLLISGGIGFRRRHFIFDFTVAQVFMPAVYVHSSSVFQPSAVRPPWSRRTQIGNGRYSSSAAIAGVGFTWNL